MFVCLAGLISTLLYQLFSWSAIRPKLPIYYISLFSYSCPFFRNLLAGCLDQLLSPVYFWPGSLDPLTLFDIIAQVCFTTRSLVAHLIYAGLQCYGYSLGIYFHVYIEFTFTKSTGSRLPLINVLSWWSGCILYMFLFLNSRRCLTILVLLDTAIQYIKT